MARSGASTEASMGPQLVRCGMPNASGVKIGDTVLQWGRNLFVAECYTGAQNRTHVWMLQWGRNLFVAECGGRHVEIRQGTAASMGPQLVRCGM